MLEHQSVKPKVAKKNNAILSAKVLKSDDMLKAIAIIQREGNGPYYRIITSFSSSAPVLHFNLALLFKHNMLHHATLPERICARQCILHQLHVH